jgi:hypothetical protein
MMIVGFVSLFVVAVANAVLAWRIGRAPAAITIVLFCVVTGGIAFVIAVVPTQAMSSLGAGVLRVMVLMPVIYGLAGLFWMEAAGIQEGQRMPGLGAFVAGGGAGGLLISLAFAVMGPFGPAISWSTIGLGLGTPWLVATGLLAQRSRDGDLAPSKKRIPSLFPQISRGRGEQIRRPNRPDDA